MTAAVIIQPQGLIVKYPRTQWRVSFVEDAASKFRFVLCGYNFKFEPRDRSVGTNSRIQLSSKLRCKSTGNWQFLKSEVLWGGFNLDA